MDLLLIIIFLLLVLTGFILYRRPQKVFNEDLKLPRIPTNHVGLFETREEVTDHPDPYPARRAELLARAAEGDRETLPEAFAWGIIPLEHEVLEVLVKWAEGSDERLLGLASYLTETNLPLSHPKIAAAQTARWRSAPDRATLAPMLHQAALTRDAASYQAAVEAATKVWREGRLTNISANDLSDLLESQYWVLTAEARHSGEGFVLKRVLVDIRRELAAAQRRASS